MELRNYGIMELRIYGFTDLRNCGVTDLWNYGIMDLRNHGFTDLRNCGVMDFWNFCLMINETTRQLVVGSHLLSRRLVVCEATAEHNAAVSAVRSPLSLL